MKKKWLVITIVIIILILIAIPSGIVLSIHNSSHDCSFVYTKIDNIINEIARKHTYYNSNDKTVEVELNQDMINSLIKDNFESLQLDLPEKFVIKEIMFNTKDQRVYINAKYGKLNIPISAKVDVKILDDSVKLCASDLKVKNFKAPGFIKKQIPEDSLEYTVKYEDLDVPQVFAIKDIQFGTGILKAIIQLDEDKVIDLAMDYRQDTMNEIDKFKADQSDIAVTFINKLLGTEVLSESKVKEYVKQALNNEELVNSAIYFATADDLSKYSNKVQEVQQKVMDWVAPLQTVKYYGSIDETVETILYDDKLKDLLAWFLPVETIDEYVATAEDYYDMYKEYYALYEEAMDAIDKAVAGIDTKKINEFTNWVLDYAGQTEDARVFLRDVVAEIDDKAINDFVYYFENDKQAAQDYISDITYAKDCTEEFLNKTYKKEIKEFTDVVTDRNKFIIDVIKQLRRKQYEQAFERLANDGVINKKTKNFVDKYSKQIDTSELEEYLNSLM